MITIFYSPFSLAHCLTFVSYFNRWCVCSFTVQDDIFRKVLSKLFFNWCDNNTTITYPFLSQTRRITPVLKKNLKLMLLMILLLVITRRGYVAYKEVCATWGEIAWWTGNGWKGESKHLKGQLDPWTPLSVLWRFLDQWRSVGSPCQWRDVFLIN